MNRKESEQFTFTANDHPVRLDVFLTAKLPQLSRSRVQALIRSGMVSIDGVVSGKASTPTARNQAISITIPPSQPTELEPEQIALDIVFENDDLLIINKPAGMVVHPAAGHSTGTLVHAVLAHVPQLEGVGGEQRPGIVHRLDRDTSGLIVVAKNERAHRWLQDQFRLRKVKKVYLALVEGHPPTPQGRVEAAIGRDPAHRKQMGIVQEGKGRDAVSEYKTVQSFLNYSLLEVHPLTGRTHQIRLHMKLIGCPIVGDEVYGRKRISLPIQRQFLHAAMLMITLPDETIQKTFEAPLPTDLKAVLEDLGQRSSP